MPRPTSGVSRVVVRGPLAPFADACREELKQRCYTRLSAVNLPRQMAGLSCWLEADGVGVERLDEACVELFLSSELAGGRHRSSVSRPGLRCLLEVLREGAWCRRQSSRRCCRLRRCWVRFGVTCCRC